MIVYKIRVSKNKYILRKDEEIQMLNLVAINKGIAESIMSYLKENNLEHLRINIQLKTN